MSEFTATVSQPDEDGYCWVTVTDGDTVEHHSIRSDQAHQWAAQECEVRNESPEERAAYLAPSGSTDHYRLKSWW